MTLSAPDVITSLLGKALWASLSDLLTNLGHGKTPFQLNYWSHSMDNYDWNDLAGKKILVFDPDFKHNNMPIIQTMKIEGCDSSIGICITYLDKEPYWITKGPLAPNKVRGGASKELLTLIYNQLRSGYFSAPTVEKAVIEIEKYRVGVVVVVSCPFSL